MQDSMDLLWSVNRPKRQVIVRIRTGTTIQIVRLRFPQLVETAPLSEWIAAGCRLLASAMDSLPSGRVSDLLAELLGDEGLIGGKAVFWYGARLAQS